MADNRNEAARQGTVEDLIEIGIRKGVLARMARSGQIIELRCETSKCYCPKGRRYFPKPPSPGSDWEPTLDHYPILKSNGGRREPWNIRLAHRLCNREDFQWRDRINRMIKNGKSLEEIAESLNALGVRRPHGSQAWTAANVRRAFVA